jgi:N-acetylmuramoyl-L-alanine amidase
MARHSAKHAKPKSSHLMTLPRANRLVVACVLGVCVLLLAIGGHASRGGFRGRSGAAAPATAQTIASVPVTPNVDAGATPVEVPSLTGLELDEAKLVLKAAGLSLVVKHEASVSRAKPTISSQDPAPGTLARTGSLVTVVLPKSSSAKKEADKTGVKRSAFVVCVDPGHQGHSDTKTEPIGPGSDVRKPRITGGTTGAVTGAPEYETVLQIATNLRQRLEAAGVTVVMTRTTNDVNLSNTERAQIANAARADLFVRLHADSSTDESLSGVSTLYPSSNAWTRPIAETSVRAARTIQTSLVKKTHAVDVGTAERGDLAGFNWSSVPVVLVGVGFPSNRVEDRLLVSPNYQDKVAQGLADGILTYLEDER